MKREYFNKLVLRAKQRAKLLIARPDFQEDVRAIRIKFKIPPIGFADDEVNQKWHHEFYQSDDEYIEKVWLRRRKEITQLEKENKYTEAEKLRNQLINGSPINSFRITIKEFLKTYKLPLRWKESLRRYVLFNNLDKMLLPIGISLKTESDKDTDLSSLYIEIEDDTTLEDIKQGWQEVKYQQKKLHSRVREKFQPIRRMDRDMKAYELDRQGLKLKDIAEVLSKEFNDNYEWYDVSKFIERHRIKLGIN